MLYVIFSPCLQLSFSFFCLNSNLRKQINLPAYYKHHPPSSVRNAICFIKPNGRKIKFHVFTFHAYRKNVRPWIPCPSPWDTDIQAGSLRPGVTWERAWEEVWGHICLLNPNYRLREERDRHHCLSSLCLHGDEQNAGTYLFIHSFTHSLIHSKSIFEHPRYVHCG